MRPVCSIYVIIVRIRECYVRAFERVCEWVHMYYVCPRMLVCV